MKEDPPLDARCRDKFLVQSVLVDDSEETNVATLWSNVEKTSKSSIQERKIRVSFLPAGSATGGAQANGVTHEEMPPAYSSPATVYGSPAPNSTSDSKSVSTAGNAKGSAANAAEATGIAGAAAAVANAMPQSQEDVKQQLAAAQAKIQELSSQLADPQVRQRKVAEAQEKVQTVIQQSQESGVPIHIVAALCLVSFLIAYLFF